MKVFTIFTSFSVLLLSFGVSTADRVSCFDCTEQGNPYACNVIRQCEEGEICFSSMYFQETAPTPFWDMGCQSESFCSLIQQPGAQNRPGTRRHRRTVGARSHKVVVCKTCCHGSYCNQVPCDRDSQLQEPPGLICHSCRDVSNPALCHQTVRCSTGEICAVWKQNNGLFSLGCKTQSVCDSENSNHMIKKRDVQSKLNYDKKRKGTKINKKGGTIFGNSGGGIKSYDDKKEFTSNDKYRYVNKRQSAAVSECRYCCNTTLCAADLCSISNTLPPVTATVATPTSSQPPPSSSSSSSAATTVATTTTTTKTATILTTLTSNLRPFQVELVPAMVATFETDNATFACDVEAQPPFDISFSRTFQINQTTVTVPRCDFRSQVPVAERTCSFTKTKLDESGSIICHVTDSLGQTKSATAYLSVEPYRNNMKVVTQPSNLELMAGDGNDTQVECAVTSVPLPDYRWYKNVSGNLEQITNSSGFEITFSAAGKSVLKLIPGSVSRQIDGSYFCRADNTFEKIDLPFSLRTITPISVVQILYNDLIDSSRKQATFSCIFRAYPAPSVSWEVVTSLNQTLTISDPKSVNSSTQGETTTSTAVIDITMLQVNRVKSVICTARNGYFTISGRADIQLLTPPTITTSTKSYSLTYGQPLRLECQADGEPSPYISWNFVDSFSVPQIVQGLGISGDGRVLTVAHVQESGVFTCYASNSLGSDAVSFQLTVV